MGSDASVLRGDGTMEVKSRFAEDVKKITFAASKLKISKRKEKPHKAVATASSPVTKKEEVKPQVAVPEKHDVIVATLPEEMREVMQADKRWTVTDLLQCLGTYVKTHCATLESPPSASEIAIWVRCADRALQMNGWTVNSFLLESHVVFTYLLLTHAFQAFTLESVVDVKEVVLMCLYISYTYNANEISYPLRPFLVKQDKSAFWDRCTSLSLGASMEMLKLNRENCYYHDVLSSLKRVAAI